MDSRNHIDDITTLPERDVPDLLSLHPSPSICINLSQTSHHFLSFFNNDKDKPNVFISRYTALDLLRQLLGHAALGEWEEAEKIWKQYPDLLSCRGTIYHPNRIYQIGKKPIDIPIEMNPGRYKYVDRTAWQIALMNEEYDEAELMGKFMTDEEKKTQFAEIFPDGKIRKYNWDREKADNLLQAVFNEVIKDESINQNDLSQMSEATKNALYALYAYMKPPLTHQAGLVFDADFYLKALQIYDDQLNKFMNENQRSFWCIRIEEWLAACLGTGYLRPHAQGLGNNLKRTGCVLSDGTSYFSFRRSIESFAGLHFFLGYFGACSSAWRLSTARSTPGYVAVTRRASIFKLMSGKNESRDRIYSAIFRNRNANVSSLLK